jgi:hypothetical protein
MAAACHDVNLSPTKGVNISSPSTVDILNCEFLKSELRVLCLEIKFLIINIVNNERESVSSYSNTNTTSSCNSCT